MRIIPTLAPTLAPCLALSLAGGLPLAAADASSAPAAPPAEDTPWYEEFSLTVGFLGAAQATLGAEDLSAEGNMTDGCYAIDLAISAPFRERDEAYLLFEVNQGEGIDGEIATFTGFNFNAGDAAAELVLSEAWYEVEVPFISEGRARGGKLDLTTLFDTNAVANDETRQYLSPGFVNNPTIEFPDDFSWGVAMRGAAHEAVTVQAALAEPDADFENILDQPFAIGEVDVTLGPAPTPTNLRLIGWYNARDHVSLDGSEDDAKGWGAAVSLDHAWNEDMASFLRYGYADADIYLIAHHLSFGSEIHLPFLGRAQDAFGWAYGMTMPGSEGEDALEAAGIDDPATEHHLEAYYRLQLSDGIHGNVDVQWLSGAAGDGEADDVWAFGMIWFMGF